MEKPIIAAVNGVAMGGDMEIVLACDIVLASTKAKFALPEVKVGFFAAAGGVQRLVRQIGEKAATEMMLTGRHVDAEEAYHLGIINEVVLPEALMNLARAKAETLIANSPSSIQATKRVLNEVALLENFDDAIDLSRPVLKDLMKTEDFSEGVKAFIEKRKPNWKNK